MIATFQIINSTRYPSEQSKPHVRYHGQHFKPTLKEKITLDAILGRISKFTYQLEKKLVNYARSRTYMGIQFGKNSF